MPDADAYSILRERVDALVDEAYPLFAGWQPEVGRPWLDTAAAKVVPVTSHLQAQHA